MFKNALLPNVRPWVELHDIPDRAHGGPTDPGDPGDSGDSGDSGDLEIEESLWTRVAITLPFLLVNSVLLSLIGG